MNLEKFKEWLILNKNSKYTIITYFRLVSDFFKEYDLFTQQNIDKFCLKKIQESSSTYNLYRCALVSYSIYSNSQNIKFPKQKKVNEIIKDFMDEKEMLELCKYFDRIFRKWPRYLTCFKFLFYTGLRLREVSKLKRADIDLQRSIVNISETKTYKARTIPVIPSLNKELQWYFQLENENDKNAFNMNRLSVEYLFKTLKDKTNYQKNLSPHIMRHSACHWWLEKTQNDIFLVKAIMGHENIQTTERYTRLNSDAIVKKAFNYLK